MRTPHVDARRSPAAASVERLARYWTSATQAQRFETLHRSISGDKEAPDYATLKVAILIAEIEAGEVEEG